MLYELRIYEPFPGKMPALHARFRDHTIGLFKKAGMGVEWFATPMTGEWSDRLYYLLSFADLADRQQKWAAFQADPEWRKAREESERDGPLVRRTRSTFLNSTPYSPGG
jgi:hypothetical protein